MFTITSITHGWLHNIVLIIFVKCNELGMARIYTVNHLRLYRFCSVAIFLKLFLLLLTMQTSTIITDPTILVCIFNNPTAFHTPKTQEWTVLNWFPARANRIEKVPTDAAMLSSSKGHFYFFIIDSIIFKIIYNSERTS